MVGPLPLSPPPSQASGPDPGTVPGQASRPSAPRLSPSQKAYQTDPEGFLARLQERAGRLFEDDYRVYPGDSPHVFLVTREGGRPVQPADGGIHTGAVTGYAVHPLERTCTCPFHTRQAEHGEYLTPDRSILPCKHQKGLPLLVKKTRRWLYENDRLAELCALWVHWMKTNASFRRERITAEQAEKEARASPTAMTAMTAMTAAPTTMAATMPRTGKEQNECR